MSTRATVARENADGSYDTIYTHWDGYPSHHAPILLEHYNTPDLVQALLDLGDLSMLGEEIGEQHPFDWITDVHTAHKSRGGNGSYTNTPEYQRYARQCTAYERDRSEQNVAARHYPNRFALGRMLAESWTEYVYIWRELERRWYWMNNPSPVWFKTCGTTQLPLALLEEYRSGEGQGAEAYCH